MHFNINRGDFEFPPFRSTDSETRAAFYFEEDVGDRQKVILQGYNGNIAVTGLSVENSVIISGTKLVGSNSAKDAEEYLQELIVEVQGLENMIFVATMQPQDISRRYIIDYTITMPKDMEIEITNSNGTVILVSIDNDIWNS